MSRRTRLAAAPVTPGAALEPGLPYPLGAHCDDAGVNFAVFSAHAERIELCLYDDAGRAEKARIELPARSGDVWHGRLPGARPGLVYGLRAHGPWAPWQGHRFNPNKLLLDPWAREIVGRFEWRPEHSGHQPGQPQRLDPRDNGHHALKARVVDEALEPAVGRRRPVPAADTVLYELHVRGFTMRHPQVPPPLRGTYAGLACDAPIEHLRRLGVTSVCLMPVQQFIDESRLVAMGLRNHWGYNPVGCFCPEPRYAASGAAGARAEFRAMVQRLHEAGFEVIVDMVFNHTAETDESGPTISWRGLDNASWYRLQPGRPELYENHSGCGNTLDLRQPRVLQMVTDCLRHWVQAMHVDGFRFDLASVLGRGDHGFSRDAPFFHAVAQDPVLAGVKMIAEPWDIGPGGYQAGHYPRGWLEWNDRFRDTMRAFWLTGEAARGEFARRLCASSDLFRQRGREPAESVNYVSSHDGFTLRDLVSYDLRHNEANGEDNRDGHQHNLSWNCGVEGPTDDPEVLGLRGRLQRALLASLLLSQGTPMLAAGSEIGHTQHGNNNPYCQDNEISWIDWSTADAGLFAYCSRLLSLRREKLPLGNRWYDGASVDGAAVDLGWLWIDGRPLAAEDWERRFSRELGAFIGRPGRGEAPLLLLVNGATDDVDFTLPPGRWRALLDSAEADGLPRRPDCTPAYPLRARSIALLETQP